MARPALVLLPGMMCDERLFAPQIAALSADYEIIVPKLTASSITQMAADVLAMVGASTFSLAGLSMGGIVAMEMVRQAPERIERLALLDTNQRADASEKYTLRNRQIEDVRAGRLRQVIVEEMKPVYLAKANAGRADLLDTLIDMALDVGADAFISQSLALRDRPDQTETLARFDRPTLVLCGKEDNLCSVDTHRQMAQLLPNATLLIIDQTGHISTLEAPQAVTDALSHWLASMQPSV